MFEQIKKLNIVAMLLVCTALPVFAVSETEILPSENVIELNVEKTDLKDALSEREEVKKQKFSLKGIGKPTGSAFDLFRSSGYTFESGPIKNQKFGFFMHGGALFDARTHEDFSATTYMASTEIQSETLFADGKTKLVMAYNLSKNLNYPNSFFQKFSSLYLSHQLNEHQTFELGETRVPIGYEGGISSSKIRMFSRSQAGRHLGNYYSTGIKNIGDYKYANYNIGFYDGSRSFCNNFEGYEFAALASFKPLAKFDGKYGDLKIGGSIDVGNSRNSYSVVGGHAIYNYKKFYADFEYLYANGLSGNYYGRGRAHGLYTTVGYFIHPRVEILARYDFYQNLTTELVSQEYSAGLNYYLSPKVKLMMQYVYATRDNSSTPSHKLYAGVDFTSGALLDLL